MYKKNLGDMLDCTEKDPSFHPGPGQAVQRQQKKYSEYYILQKNPNRNKSFEIILIEVWSTLCASFCLKWVCQKPFLMKVSGRQRKCREKRTKMFKKANVKTCSNFWKVGCSARMDITVDMAWVHLPRSRKNYRCWYEWLK